MRVLHLAAEAEKTTARLLLPPLSGKRVSDTTQAKSLKDLLHAEAAEKIVDKTTKAETAQESSD